MIAPTGASSLTDPGLARRAAPASRSGYVAVVLAGGAPARRAAPAPRPRRLAAALDALAGDGGPVPACDRSRVAALAFAAGDGFLPGQIIDRTI
jgi:hypothetical protein